MEDTLFKTEILPIDTILNQKFLEIQNNSERISSNMNYLSTQGLLKPSPMFGYKFVAKGVPFAIDEEEQKIIQHIKEIRMNNPELSLNKISQILNDEGVKIRKGKKIYVSRLIQIMDQNGIDKFVSK